MDQESVEIGEYFNFSPPNNFGNSFDEIDYVDKSNLMYEFGYNGSADYANFLSNEYGETVPVYESLIIRQGLFAGRKINTLLEIPIRYVKIPSADGSFIYNYTNSNKPARFTLTGSAMGVISDNNCFKQYYGDGINEGNVQGGATETRTKILSVQGSIKFSANLNAEVFQAGTELGANFTISTTTSSVTRFVLMGIYKPVKANYTGTTLWEGYIQTTAYFPPGDWRD